MQDVASPRPATDPTITGAESRPGLIALEEPASTPMDLDQQAIAKDSLFFSPLGRLPTELRQQIWSHLLTSGPNRPPAVIPWPTLHLSTNLTPSILRTCKTIYQETAPILYSQNNLHFTHVSDLNIFPWTHNRTLATTHISHLQLHIQDTDYKSLWSPYLSSTNPTRSLRHDYPHLKSLRISFTSYFWYVQSNVDPINRFQKWANDRNLREICAYLEDILPSDCDLKVLMVVPIWSRELVSILRAFPRELHSVTDFKPDWAARYQKIGPARTNLGIEAVGQAGLAGLQAAQDRLRRTGDQWVAAVRTRWVRIGRGDCALEMRLRKEVTHTSNLGDLVAGGTGA